MRILFLLFFSSFIIPVYAQSENDASLNNEFKFTTTTALAIAVVGGILGALVSFILFIKYEQNETQQDIDKVRKLIKTDLSHLHTWIIDLQKEISEPEQGFENFDNIDSLIRHEMTVEEFFENFDIWFEFTNWDVLISSGYIMKLSSEEIGEIQVIYDGMKKWI